MPLKQKLWAQNLLISPMEEKVTFNEANKILENYHLHKNPQNYILSEILPFLKILRFFGHFPYNLQSSPEGELIQINLFSWPIIWTILFGGSIIASWLFVFVQFGLGIEVDKL